MTERIREIWTTLNRSIFVGDRYEKNLRNIATTGLIIAVLGLVMTLINAAQGQYVMALTCFFILLAGAVSHVFAARFRNREAAVVSAAVIVVAVLTYDVLYADNGFAFIWTLLVPLSMCYMFSVRMGALATAYFQLLFIVIFYTPLRAFVAPHYAEIVMNRFPVLYFFHGLLVLYVMYQYHRSVLFEIDYAARLNDEVARQTAVAEERSRKIEQMSFQAIQTLAHAIDAKDPYPKGHSTRVSEYSVMIAQALGWPKERVDDLRCAALMHDIGKIGVPDSILNNPSRLTDVEYDIIKSHTTMGGDILHGRVSIDIAEDVAISHHERYDGQGYPRGLKGEEISEEARIAAIADAFDAMSSNRVYRKACDVEHIRRELIEGRGKQFDPHFVDVFINLWDLGMLDDIMRRDSAEDEGSLEASSALLQEVVEAFASQGAADDIDITTGILSRGAGETAIAQRMRQEPGCFVFFDMDNLKKINDTNGHNAGDRALRLMGDTLARNGEGCVCCRLGGDEFLLFIPSVDEGAAEAQVRRIIDDFEAEKAKDVEIAPASLSAGLVMCTPADTFAQAYAMADKALYHVKQNGKDGYSFYSQSSEASGNATMDIRKLVDAIRNSGSYEGALDVEYRQFAKLYEFIGNLEKRFRHPFKLIMITLQTSGGGAPHAEELEKAMYYMEQSIRQTIRNVDVITRYNRQQFLIILLGADPEGVRIAVDRIFRGYYKMNGSGAFSPSYAVADLEGPASARREDGQ